MKKIKKALELYASRIYPNIFTRINSLFKAGEGTLCVLKKRLHVRGFVERYAMLAARSNLTRKDKNPPKNIEKVHPILNCDFSKF